MTKQELILELEAWCDIPRVTEFGKEMALQVKEVLSRAKSEPEQEPLRPSAYPQCPNCGDDGLGFGLACIGAIMFFLGYQKGTEKK